MTPVTLDPVQYQQLLDTASNMIARYDALGVTLYHTNCLLMLVLVGVSVLILTTFQRSS